MSMTTTTNPSRTIVRSSEDAAATWFNNALMTTLATHEETVGSYALMEHTFTAACNPPVHIQEVEDEAFYLLDGEIEFEIDGEVVLAGPGTFALVPRGAAHTFRVLSEVARALVIVSGDAPSGGLHSFFHAAGQPAVRCELPVPSAPDVETLGRYAAQHGISLIGPPA